MMFSICVRSIRTNESTFLWTRAANLISQRLSISEINALRFLDNIVSAIYCTLGGSTLALVPWDEQPRQSNAMHAIHAVFVKGLKWFLTLNRINLPGLSNINGLFSQFKILTEIYSSYQLICS